MRELVMMDFDTVIITKKKDLRQLFIFNNAWKQLIYDWRIVASIDAWSRSDDAKLKPKYVDLITHLRFVCLHDMCLSICKLFDLYSVIRARICLYGAYETSLPEFLIMNTAAYHLYKKLKLFRNKFVGHLTGDTIIDGLSFSVKDFELLIMDASLAYKSIYELCVDENYVRIMDAPFVTKSICVGETMVDVLSLLYEKTFSYVDSESDGFVSK